MKPVSTSFTIRSKKLTWVNHRDRNLETILGNWVTPTLTLENDPFDIEIFFDGVLI